MSSSWFRTTFDEAPHLQGQLEHWHLPVAGRERHAVVYRGARGGDAWLLFHGSLGSGEGFRRQSGHAFERHVDAHGGVVVYADGVGGHWNDGRRHARFSARRQNVGDVALVRALAQRLRRECESRLVRGVGFSNGGHLLYRVAAEAPHLLDGIVNIAANLSAPGHTEFELARLRAPLLLVVGTADRINRFDGGPTRFFGMYRGHVLSATESIERLQELAAPCIRVGGLMLPAAGHTVPQPFARMPRVMGRTASHLDIAVEASRFFQRPMAARSSSPLAALMA